MNIWVTLYRMGWTALGILFVVGVAALFLPPLRQYQDLRQKKVALQEDVLQEEDMLNHLRKQQERLRTDPRFVEKIAREEWGYAKTNETVFKFVDDEPQTAFRAR